MVVFLAVGHPGEGCGQANALGIEWLKASQTGLVSPCRTATLAVAATFPA